MFLIKLKNQASKGWIWVDFTGANSNVLDRGDFTGAYSKVLDRGRLHRGKFEGVG